MTEKLGERCIDDGRCHHQCKDKCFRRECCEPLSGYKGEWKYDQPPAAQPVDDERITTNAMLHAERLDRIERLENLLREAHENLREWMFQLDDNASHDSTQFSFCRGCGIVEYRDHRKDCSANALVERIAAALKEGA